MRAITFLSVPFFGLVIWLGTAVAVIDTLNHMTQTTQRARITPAVTASAMVTAGR